MFTRKTRKGAFHPLTMALTVVILLAMLVPIASASQDAPEWLHGVEITSPTGAAPAIVDAGDVTVAFTLTFIPTQVYPVDVRIRVFDQTNSEIFKAEYKLPVPSAASQTYKILNSKFPGSGWYDIEVCATDDGDYWWCDFEKKAVQVDQKDPGAKLVKPESGAWISGQDYLLVGKAWDPAEAESDPLLSFGGIVSTQFYYCVKSNFANDKCGTDNKSWVKIADGMPTPGVANQYDAIWDTTSVPDDTGYIAFCAVDIVGRVDCDWNKVYVNNRYTVDLRPGWNLVSTPLMLYNDDMDSVLLHLVAKDTVKSVWWYSGGVWTKWTPGDASKFEHGQGYWIEMKAVDRLTFVGNWKNTGNQTPPEYAVATGWNLIGYTPWGQPVVGPPFPDRTVADYLQGPVASSMQALWRYDAGSGYYIPLYADTYMLKGAGYWLAVARAGVIRP